jgi:hypothetical protein
MVARYETTLSASSNQRAVMRRLSGERMATYFGGEELKVYVPSHAYRYGFVAVGTYVTLTRALNPASRPTPSENCTNRCFHRD